jgi:hypothetical protein
MPSLPHEGELERIGEEGVKAAMPSPGTYLPQLTVERLRKLSTRDDEALLELIAHAAILLAARSEQMTTPWRVLMAGLDGIAFTEESWYKKVRPEVRKVIGVE